MSARPPGRAGTVVWVRAGTKAPALKRTQVPHIAMVAEPDHHGIVGASTAKLRAAATTACSRRSGYAPSARQEGRTVSEKLAMVNPADPPRASVSVVPQWLSPKPQIDPDRPDMPQVARSVEPPACALSGLLLLRRERG